MYLGLYLSNSIEKFTPAGVSSVFATTHLNGPEGMTFDASGNLYVANFGDNTIAEFTTGGSGSTFANTGLNGPDALTFDSLGNLYAANLNANSIEVFTSGGVGSQFATGLSSPGALAFTAIPKPATCAAIFGALALGVAGVRGHRRRRQLAA